MCRLLGELHQEWCSSTYSIAVFSHSDTAAQLLEFLTYLSQECLLHSHLGNSPQRMLGKKIRNIILSAFFVVLRWQTYLVVVVGVRLVQTRSVLGQKCSFLAAVKQRKRKLELQVPSGRVYPSCFARCSLSSEGEPRGRCRPGTGTHLRHFSARVATFKVPSIFICLFSK